MSKIEIPRELVLAGVGESVKAMNEMLEGARTKYGPTYNNNNEYEVATRHFNFKDSEAVLREYDLIREKRSAQPASVRRVIQQIGDNALRYGYVQVMKQQEAEKKEEEIGKK